ncbi:MAG: glycosyltransferase family 4 protein [Winkia neuii]|uniref:glycosyltransferase family 4 protein n=1 Tax=Winkia neuii TaxID=33007 RepID=UPI001E45DC46|nr:glycosyltransferase family 4 protein [Winkia neuii]MDK8099974.1 glycosyltransferase family 4 protein [Winkia neuii]MDU3134986.1 glycosyltransferase family 4 protein [Winkia neuii]
MSGGVQVHIRDIAQVLSARGHQVEVLGPATKDPGFSGFTSAGPSVSIPYNGSVARLSFGPRSAARVRAWLEEGNFDLIHVHEPASPSVSLLALAHAKCPVVATFHSNMTRSLALKMTSPILVPLMDKLDARIAVSDEARRTVVEHLGGDAVVIPNGVSVADFQVSPVPKWQGSTGAPTFAFLGRLDEERKGLPVFAKAIRRVAKEIPKARFLIAGRGEATQAKAGLQGVEGAQFIGGVSDREKAELLASATAYVAPQTGGESFGIVLVEAMAAGAPVIASDLVAFTAVLNGEEYGVSFKSGDGADLAQKMLRLATDRSLREELSRKGRRRALQYDWQAVTDKVEAVYRTVLGAK